ALLLDDAAAKRRAERLQLARSVYLAPEFAASAAGERVVAGAPAPAGRGRGREELLAALEELAAWYRDLVAFAAGAETAVHCDHADELREDASVERLAAAEHAAELAREAWRNFEEFNLNAPLALEALFVLLRRAFAGARVAARVAGGPQGGGPP